MRTRIVSGLLTVFSSLLFGQTKPDVAEILKKVAETYRGATTYDLQISLQGRITGHTRMSFKAPNRYRMEMEGAGIFGNDPAFDGAVVVCDGSAIWVNLPKSNQYVSFAVSELTSDAPGDLGDIMPGAVDKFLMSRYREAGDYADGAKLLRQETIELAGAAVDCYVLQIPIHRDPAVYTWWIDKKTSRILREDHAGSISLFTMIELNEPIPDDLFKFTPPPGAKKIEGRP